MDNKKIIQNIKSNIHKKNIEPCMAIHDVFKDKEAIVISGGPSAVFWKEIYEENRDAIIICIKQAIELDQLNRIAHLHFLNPYNIKKYKKKSNGPLTFMTSHNNAPKCYGSFDITMNIDPKCNFKIENSTCALSSYESYTLKKTGLVRNFGPGIMHESVLPVLLHMGFKKVEIVGWDVALGDSGIKHVYDKKLSWLDKLLKNRNFIKYILGKNYNIITSMPGENEIVKSKIDETVNWYRSKGLEIKIYGKN